MRLGLAFLVAAFLAACSEGRLDQARRELGCAPIDGLRPILGGKQPAWLVVGEFTETNEAPAAFAELACNLAAGGPLFVGVSEYLGGATDAETRMRARLDELKWAAVAQQLRAEEREEQRRMRRWFSG